MSKIYFSGKCKVKLVKDIRAVLLSIDTLLSDLHSNCNSNTPTCDPTVATCSIDIATSSVTSDLVASEASNLDDSIVNTELNQNDNNENGKNLIANDTELTSVDNNLKGFNCCNKDLSTSESDCCRKQLEKQQEAQAAKLLKEEDSFFTCLNFNQENNRLASFAGEIRVGASFQVFILLYLKTIFFMFYCLGKIASSSNNFTV